MTNMKKPIIITLLILLLALVVTAKGNHWINSVSSGGRIIILEDDSVWEVNSADRIDTALWLPIDDILLLDAGSKAFGKYKYLMINLDEHGEEALVRYVGK
jgi:hypothetical protein